MPYDAGLAQRIRGHFGTRPDLSEKKMFGGLCFMFGDHMGCGVVGDTLIARVGPERYDEYLRERDARIMDFTGKPLKGMLYVSPDGIESNENLALWLDRCDAFVSTLPPKQPKSTTVET